MTSPYGRHQSGAGRRRKPPGFVRRGWPVSVPFVIAGMLAFVTSSQASGSEHSALTSSAGAASVAPFPAGPYVLSLDPHHGRSRSAATAGPLRLPRNLQPATLGIPRRVLQAYVTAAHNERSASTTCHLRWQLLAGIGYIESDHARAAIHPLRSDGIARPPIYGPMLDGSSGAAISDTDHGVLDGSTRWDRAVGPMQFIPSTWESYGVDGDRDHRANPQDVDDASAAAGVYLCAAGGDLSVKRNLLSAVFAYNHSWAYVRAVLSVTAAYAGIDPSALGINLVPKSGRHEGRHITTQPTLTSSQEQTIIGLTTPTPQPAGPTPRTSPPSDTPPPTARPTPSGPATDPTPSDTPPPTDSGPPSDSPPPADSPSDSPTTSDTASPTDSPPSAPFTAT